LHRVDDADGGTLVGAVETLDVGLAAMIAFARSVALRGSPLYWMSAIVMFGSFFFR